MSQSQDIGSIIAGLKFNADGLIPAVVQSADTGRVLMLAWMSAESVKLTLEKGETVFWSRSRQEMWHKGATSGNTQHLVRLQADCDGDTLLALVHEAGPACHNGTESCFDTVEVFSSENHSATEPEAK
jgi:phosphoribosyl-AMP cyclohydrolase